MSPKRAAIYARVSTGDQSVEMQLADLRAYAQQRGFVVFKEFQDVASGSTTTRPSLDELMDGARKRLFDVVLVWRFDRFARSTRHLVSALAEFRAVGVDFISFNEAVDTSSPIGEALFTIIGAMAQLERDIIRERVRGGLRAARAKGKRLGRPRVRDDGAIQSLRAQGHSLRSIARQLKTSMGAVQRCLGAASKTRVAS